MHNIPGATHKLAQSIRAAGWLLTGLAALPLPNVFAADSSDQEPTLKSVTVTATRRKRCRSRFR